MKTVHIAFNISIINIQSFFFIILFHILFIIFLKHLIIFFLSFNKVSFFHWLSCIIIVIVALIFLYVTLFFCHLIYLKLSLIILLRTFGRSFIFFPFLIFFLLIRTFVLYYRILKIIWRSVGIIFGNCLIWNWIRILSLNN